MPREALMSANRDHRRRCFPCPYCGLAIKTSTAEDMRLDWSCPRCGAHGSMASGEGKKEQAGLLLELDKVETERQELANKIGQDRAAHEKTGVGNLAGMKLDLEHWAELTMKREQLKKALGRKASIEG